MEISDAELNAFRQIYLDEFGIELTDAHALKEARRLLALMQFALGGPAPPAVETDEPKDKIINS